MKNIKFLLIVPDLKIASGGPPKVATSVANGLLRRNHEVTVITTVSGSDEYALDSGVRLIRLGSLVGRLSVICKEMRGADVCIVTAVWGIIEGLYLRMSGNLRQVCFIRPCGMLEPYIMSKGRFKKKLAWNFYVKSNLESVRGLLPNTIIEQNNISKLGVRKEMIVIPNGCDQPMSGERLGPVESAESLGLTAQEGKKYILFMARLHPKKGLDILIDAFKNVSANLTEWDLIIAGPIEDARYVEKIKNGLTLDHLNRIHFVGEVMGDRKRACLSISSIFCLPSHSEGFPNAVVEALAWSLPAIITPGCNFPQLSESNAGVQVQADPDSVSEGIYKLCGDPKFLLECSQNALRLVSEKYSVKRVLDLYESLFHNMPLKN